MRELITRVLGFGSQNTYYSWKREKRPIISLVEKYFSENDLKEFLETGEISSYHSFHLHQERIENFFDINLDLINDSMGYEGLYIYFKFFSKYKEVLFTKIKGNQNKKDLQPDKFNTFIQYHLNKFFVEEKIYNSSLELEFAQFSIYLLEHKFEIISYIIQSFYTDFRYISTKETQKIHVELTNSTNNIEDFYGTYQKLYLK